MYNFIRVSINKIINVLMDIKNTEYKYYIDHKL